MSVRVFRVALWHGCFAMLALLLFLLSMPVIAADKVRIVASFSILGDLVKEVGGDKVHLTTLVGADGDAHVYQPSPRDAGAVAKADLLVINGLGFEGWIERLIESSGYKGTQVVATSGIEPLRSGHPDDHDDPHGEHGTHHKGHDDHHDHGHHKAEHNDHDSGHQSHDRHHSDHSDHSGHNHGEWDPHAWHDIHNAIIYVRNITRGLSEADPANRAFYQANAAAYVKKLESLHHELEHLFEDIPAAQRKVITPHDAFGYFGRAWQMEFIAPQGTSTEAEASAGDVARIIRQIREHSIRAIFIENIGDSRLIEQISRETGAVVGGALFSDALSAGNGPAGTYLKMIRHNAHTLAEALTPGE